MKQLLKRLYKSEWVHHLLARLGALYIRLVLWTGRMHTHIPEESAPYFRGEMPAIFVLWHSRIMLIQSHVPPRAMCALVSKHADGRMIGRVLEHFGIESIYGSTSKGGVEALRALISAYKNGCNLAITPDGPRGPARIASQGVAQLAMMTNAPVICVGYAASRCRTLNSWDSFVVGLPFASLHFVASRPIFYLPDASIDKQQNRERLRCSIESCLNDITDEADCLATA